jgi:hypothetical protein
MDSDCEDMDIHHLFRSTIWFNGHEELDGEAFGMPRSAADESSLDSIPELEPCYSKDFGLENAPDFLSFIQQRVPILPLPLASVNPKIGAIRYGFLTVYRRLFSIVFVGNLVALVIILARHRTSTALFSATTANLVVCGFARLPYVINGMFLAVHFLASSLPLSLRRRAAKVGHYGGVHSGCGISAFCWYTCAVAVVTYQYAVSEPPLRLRTAVLALLYLILGLLLGMILVAYPMFRFINHNVFELTHRFSSWVLIVLLWSAYMQLVHDASHAEARSFGTYLLQDPTFWFVIVLTMTLIAPWVTLGRVPVTPEYVSDHAVRLHFKYATTRFSQGVSISTHPLRDWHTFAGIPDTSGKGFSLLISDAGDWTSARVKDPPTQIWKRAVPTYGFAYSALLFRRVIIVTTGSGIGPALSLLGADEGIRPKSRVLWQTRNPMRTYGKGIMEAVHRLDDDAIIIDTDQYGRQDFMAVAWSLFKHHEAEAAFVISRPNLTRKLVYAFEARGVSAYAPIFDS